MFEIPEPSEIRGRIPTLRAIPLPADTNPSGDVFGGWLLSQMDLAGGSRAYHYAGGRVVTVGINEMSFHRPLFVGDEVSFYTEIIKVGRTSLTIGVDSWALRRHNPEYVKITEGRFTYVAINERREPVALPEIRKGG